MPDVTPTGAIAEALDGLRTLISALTFFQTFTSAADAAAALPHILVGEVGARGKSSVLASNVATFETHEPHNLAVSQKIMLEGFGSPYDGNRTVASVPTSTSFTVSITNADVAAAEITEEQFAKVWPAQRPWLVLMDSEDTPLEIQHVGTGPAAIVRGEVLIFVDGVVSSSYQNDPRNAKYEMLNNFSQLMDGLARLSEDYHSWTVEEPPAFVREQEHYTPQIRFERWNAILRCRFGLEG